MSNIAIHRKPHAVLRRLMGTLKIAALFLRETRAVQLRTAFSDASCLKLSVNGYITQKNDIRNGLEFLTDPSLSHSMMGGTD